MSLVRQTRQDRQAVPGHTRAVPDRVPLAPAEQFEELDSVARGKPSASPATISTGMGRLRTSSVQS